MIVDAALLERESSGAEPGNPFIGEVIKNCVRAQTDRQWVREISERDSSDVS